MERTEVSDAILGNKIQYLVLEMKQIWMSSSGRHWYIGSSRCIAMYWENFTKFSFRKKKITFAHLFIAATCNAFTCAYVYDAWLHNGIPKHGKKPYCPFRDLSHNYDRFLFNFSRLLSDCVCVCVQQASPEGEKTLKTNRKIARRINTSAAASEWKSLKSFRTHKSCRVWTIK